MPAPQPQADLAPARRHPPPRTQATPMPAPQPEAALALGAAASLDAAARERIEAAAFRKLVAHLRERTDVQNIDMMNLAGFCRNCLSRWYREGAEARGIPLADPDARELAHGMPHKAWQ